jgi:3-isopropylmalate dehydrogenase
VRPEQGLLALRQALGLYANLRPVTVHPALAGASPLRPELLAGVDLLVVRELTGGIYFGQPRERRYVGGEWEAVDTMVYREHEIQRIAALAFELARSRRGQSPRWTKPTSWKARGSGARRSRVSPLTSRT